jgi:hypothetical protein
VSKVQKLKNIADATMKSLKIIKYTNAAQYITNHELPKLYWDGRRLME